jgi:Protein of unknown function (DUF3800)
VGSSGHVLPIWPAPRGQKSEDSLAIQAYIDDSGSDGQGRSFTLAGFIAKAEDWLVFSDEWQTCLSTAPAISRFKMRDAVHCRGAFTGFTKSDRDKKVRALARIINRHADTAIHCTMDLEAFAETVALDSGIGPPLTEPYFYPYQIMIMAVCYELLDHGQTERYEIIFDEHVIFRPRVKWWYPVTRHHMPADCQAIAPIEPIFRSDDEFLPLQAADLLAWLIRRSTAGLSTPFDWVVAEFSKVPMSPHQQFLDRERMEWWGEESKRLAPSITVEMLAKRNELLGFNEPSVYLPHWKRHALPPSDSRKSPSAPPTPAGAHRPAGKRLPGA